MASVLKVEGVGKRFGEQAVLCDVSFTLEERQLLTVIGPNGSGKTTLLRLLLGLDAPDSGAVWRKPGLRIGYMPQHLNMDATLPVTAEWFVKLHSHRHVPDAAEMRKVCEETGIAHALNRPLHGLSSGERQRLLLARALLCRPELLVLDEPAQGVDITGQAQLYALIARAARERGAAVLMVSHDLNLVMASTDEVICLNHHICCHGHPHAVKDDPAFAALFGPQVAKNLAVYVHHHDHEH